MSPWSAVRKMAVSSYSPNSRSVATTSPTIVSISSM